MRALPGRYIVGRRVFLPRDYEVTQAIRDEYTSVSVYCKSEMAEMGWEGIFSTTLCNDRPTCALSLENGESVIIGGEVEVEEIVPARESEDHVGGP